MMIRVAWHLSKITNKLHKINDIKNILNLQVCFRVHLVYQKAFSLKQVYKFFLICKPWLWSTKPLSLSKNKLKESHHKLTRVNQGKTRDKLTTFDHKLFFLISYVQILSSIIVRLPFPKQRKHPPIPQHSHS